MAEIIIAIVLIIGLALCIKYAGTEIDKPFFYLNPKPTKKDGTPSPSKTLLLRFSPIIFLAIMVLLLPIAFGPINGLQGAVILVGTLLFSFGLQYLVIKRNK